MLSIFCEYGTDRADHYLCRDPECTCPCGHNAGDRQAARVQIVKEIQEEAGFLAKSEQR